MILLIMEKIIILREKRKYKEYFFNKEFEILDLTDNGIVDNTSIFTVPQNHFLY